METSDQAMPSITTDLSLIKPFDDKALLWKQINVGLSLIFFSHWIVCKVYSTNKKAEIYTAS